MLHAEPFLKARVLRKLRTAKGNSFAGHRNYQRSDLQVENSTIKPAKVVLATAGYCVGQEVENNESQESSMDILLRKH